MSASPRRVLAALFPPRAVKLFWLPVLALTLGTELGSRLLGGPECEPISPDATGWDSMIGHPRMLWALAPNDRTENNGIVTQTNGVGLRTDLEPEVPKGQDEIRVGVTGDSSVFGWGQNQGETYADALQADLQRALPGQRVRVINLGVPGFSTEQTLVLMEELGWSYDLDLLVVHNVFSDAHIDHFQDREALALANPDRSPVYRALHGSRAYCALYMPFARWRASSGQQPGRVLMPGAHRSIEMEAMLEAADSLVDLSRVPLDHYVANLGLLVDRAREHEVEVMLAPLAQETDVGLWTHHIPEPEEGTVLPWVPYREAGRAFAEERGLLFVDVPAAYAQAPGHPEQLFIDAVHPSSWGGEVLARAVVEGLRGRPELLGVELLGASSPLEPPPYVPRARPGEHQPGGPVHAPDGPDGPQHGPPPGGGPPPGAPPAPPR